MSIHKHICYHSVVIHGVVDSATSNVMIICLSLCRKNTQTEEVYTGDSSTVGVKGFVFNMS